MPDLSQRSTQAELMDDLSMPVAAIRRNLQELETVNRLLGGYSLVLKALDALDWPAERPLRIMDIGSGGGDTLRVIAGWARAKGRAVALTGVDMNRAMVDYARERSAHFPEIRYCELNVFDAALLEEARPDVITCNLFCHHFRHSDLIALLQRLQGLSGRLIIINDLHRHWFAYHAIRTLTRLFSRSYMVRHDGPLSVARAFTRKDWIAILAEAGLRDYSIRWRWAWRWEVLIHKHSLPHEARL